MERGDGCRNPIAATGTAGVAGTYAGAGGGGWRTQTNAANADKPPFDARIAKSLLAAAKDSGLWPIAPNEDVTRNYLLQIFSGVSNDPHREIRREVWPDMHRGRRTKQDPAD